MKIPNDNTQNCPFYGLQLVVETFGELMNQPTKKSPKMSSNRIRKHSYKKNLGTRVINSPMSPPLPDCL